MERLNPYWFYKAGAYLRLFAELPKGTTVTSGKRTSEYAALTLKTIVDGMGPVPLPKCIAPAKALLRDIESVFRPPDHEISESALEHFAQAVAHIETMIQADVLDLDVFRVKPKGIFSTRSLIERADEHLGHLGRLELTDEMTRDIRAAGLCLGFEAFTACGFHCFRALEAVARRYHTVVTTKTLERATLGDILSSLVRHHEMEKDPKKRDRTLDLVIGLLRKVKDDRDAIMHPELVLDHEAALQVFKVTCAAIDAMEEHRFKLRSADTVRNIRVDQSGAVTVEDTNKATR